jgi:hypothetical protein
MATSREETRERKRSGAPATGSKMARNTKQGSETSNITDQATGKQKDGEDLLQHAKKATGEIVTQVQQRVGSQLDRQKDSAASDLASVVNAVRRFGESLAGEEGGPITRYAAEYGDRAADSLDRFASYIREQDTRKLMSDVTDFGKRRPALLLGGAFLLGFAGARLIKSAVDDRTSGESSDQHFPSSQPANTTDAPLNV